MFKKCVSVLCVALIAAASFVLPVHAQEGSVSVSAQAAVVINADNGQVLYAKNAENQQAMASTTKIMTALLTLEEAAKENKIVTISEQVAAVEGSSMYLNAGDRLSLKDLAIGMLTVSGNDAAYGAAVAIGGSEEEFAQLMNAREKELGMEHTNFVTASGLDADEHYSTALDMAKLGAAAIQNEDFLAICSKTQSTATFVNPPRTQSYSNHNKLLKLYQGCIGIKTGFTKKAGRCLVSAAERDGVRLVAVTLNAPDDWNDHIKLFDYGFSQLSSIRMDESNTTFTVDVVGGTSDQIEVTGSDGGSVVVSAADKDKVERIVLLPNFTYAPFPQGTQLGKISYQLNGEEIGSVPLVTTAAVEQQTVEQGIFQKIGDFFRNLFG